MIIKPTMSMFATVDELNSALAQWYAAENDRLKRTLKCIADNPGWLDHHCRAQGALDKEAQHELDK